MKRLQQSCLSVAVASALSLAPAPSHSATIAADGGITLYVSYANLNVACYPAGKLTLNPPLHTHDGLLKHSH